MTYLSDWWCGTFHILGIPASQLTFVLFRGVAQPPTRYMIRKRWRLYFASYSTTLHFPSYFPNHIFQSTSVKWYMIGTNLGFEALQSEKCAVCCCCKWGISSGFMWDHGIKMGVVNGLYRGETYGRLGSRWFVLQPCVLPGSNSFCMIPYYNSCFNLENIESNQRKKT